MAALGRAALPVPTVVVGNDPVVGRQVRDLVAPDPDGAGDAVGEDDRPAMFGTEDLGVQPGTVDGLDFHGTAWWQRRGTPWFDQLGLTEGGHTAPFGFGDVAGGTSRTYEPTYITSTGLTAKPALASAQASAKRSNW